jgi:hypothetical protein
MPVWFGERLVTVLKFTRMVPPTVLCVEMLDGVPLRRKETLETLVSVALVEMLVGVPLRRKELLRPFVAALEMLVSMACVEMLVGVPLRRKSLLTSSHPS